MNKNLTCPNCGSQNQQNALYCQNCSQKTKLQINSVWRMLVNFVANIIDYDAKLFSSIRGLFFPGFLTKEYLANHRASYLTPIRLFIFLMFTTFAVMSYLGIDDALKTNNNGANDGLSLQFNVENDTDEPEVQNNYYSILEKGYQSLRYETLFLRLDAEISKHLFDIQQLNEKLEQKLTKTENKQEIQDKIANNLSEIISLEQAIIKFQELKVNVDIKEGKPINIKLLNNTYKISPNDFSKLSAQQLIDKYQVTYWLDKIFFEKIYKLNTDSKAFGRFVFQNLTWVIFIELLLMSLFFKILYIRSKRKYVEYFIMQLHVHSWLFFIVLFALLIPYLINDWQIFIVLLLIAIYLFMTMKNIYQQSYIVTLLKFIVLTILALITFLLSFVLVLIVGSFFF